MADMSDYFQVWIVCDDASHSPKVARIAAALYAGMEDDSPGWVVDPKSSDVQELSEEGEQLDVKRLNGGINLPPDWDYIRAHPVRRQRLDLRCPLCGFHVPVRGEKARNLLERLRHAKGQPVSLRALKAYTD